MPTNVSWKRMLFATLFLTVAATLSLSEGWTETSVKSTAGSANQNDWLHFNPQKFSAPERLVPAASVAPAKSGSFEKGVPSFPHDPTHTNVIYGRGKDELPTAIYAKAFDVLTIGGKLFQTPAAGEVKQISVNGQAIALYGTTVYTPLPNTAMVANPVQIQPFDPSRVFYKDKDTWPAVIYAVPGKQITIANQTFVVPPAGQTLALIFDASGHLKQSPQSSGAKSNPDANKESSKSGEQSDNKSGTGSSNQPAAEKTATEKAATEKAASEKAAAEKAAAEKAVEKAVLEKAAAEKAAAERAASEKAAAEKAAAAKLAAEKAAAEKAASEKAAAERAAAEKAAAERAAAEKAALERAAAEKAAAEKAAAEQAAAEAAASAARAAAEKAAADKAAADKAAADKAAADQAAADKAAADKAAADKSAADKAAAEEELRKKVSPADLNGVWSLTNLATTHSSRVRIANSGSAIEATIADQGNGYIPVGQMRFKGNYVSNPFPGTTQRSYPNFSNPYMESAVITVIDRDYITVVGATGDLLVIRDTLPPDPSATPSPQPTDPSKTKPPTPTSPVPEKLKPTVKDSIIDGKKYTPSPEFVKKVEDFIAGLSKAVQDWLIKNGFKFVAEVYSTTLPQAFANTDGKTISIQEYEKVPPDAKNGKPGGFVNMNPTIDSQLYSQGRHEIGHAMGATSNVDGDQGFKDAYAADTKNMSKENQLLLARYTDGHGDGRSPFTNPSTGGNETMAQLIGYEVGARNQMSMDVAKAMPQTAAYIHSHISSIMK